MKANRIVSVIASLLATSTAALAGDAPVAAPSAESILRDLGARNAGYHDFGGVVDMVLSDAPIGTAMSCM